jgi:hypothetical protein
MNGIRDLGGGHGFGPGEPEENMPMFHEEWERQLYAMRMSVPGRITSSMIEERFRE